MNDITPELLEKINKLFDERTSEREKLKVDIERG